MSEPLTDQKLTGDSRSAGGSGSPEIELLYKDGATPLFLAIEDTNWREALDIAEASPKQIRTWVRSTGTENTTFDWALWRRLPIHEVSSRYCVLIILYKYGHTLLTPLFQKIPSRHADPVHHVG